VVWIDATADRLPRLIASAARTVPDGPRIRALADRARPLTRRALMDLACRISAA
jgi:hypothetical protein